jgi:hypothetical protein
MLGDLTNKREPGSANLGVLPMVIGKDRGWGC